MADYLIRPAETRDLDAVAGIYNRIHDAPEEQVFVLHTLVIAPEAAGRGYGRAFVAFYEDLARKNGCTELRMDTNERNLAARTLYHKLGYTEVDILPTVFNGISGVNLVLLEKYLGA